MQTLTITLTPEAEATLRTAQRLPDEMLRSVALAMDRENQYTVSHIQADYMSFPKDEPATMLGLRVQTNRLRGSIRASKAIVENGAVVSAIGSNVEYAAIHEFGGTIPAHDIVPKNGKALRFMIGDRVIFAKKVHIGERVMPARAPITKGIEDRLGDYAAAMSAAIVNAWKEGK